MDASKLLVGSDLGLMNPATILLVIVIGFGMAGFYKKMVEEDARNAK
ncbi:MAG: hypothetical protein IT510_12000 [Sulfuritalea sp.]|jgi:hypothetical protein|nr:hypothetical protein [Sulfuritalea sp.]